MKKRKMMISPALIKSEKKIAAEVDMLMAKDESERYKDERCVGMPRCIRCNSGEDVIRKPFVPIDAALKLELGNNHTTTLICICAQCLVAIMANPRQEQIDQVLSTKELKQYLTRGV
jgi:hypothetical protein